MYMISNKNSNKPRGNEKIALELIVRLGLLRPKELAKHGIARVYLRRLENKMLVEKVTRGVYRAINSQVSGQHGLAEVSKRIPGCIICLLSALQFHQIGTELPGKTWIALQRGSWHPKIDYPPTEIATFSSILMQKDVETHTIDGVSVRITSVARTIADCFKFRNKIGIEPALEGLKDALHNKRCLIEDLSSAARLCRVEKVMRPYIEALL
jgi:predicted transcriptional regulator of viral defense system